MEKTAVIIGNIFSLCAMVSDSISGTKKKHSEIMGIQIISQFFYAFSTIALKGYSGTAQNAVAVFRNLAAMKNIKSKILEWVLVLAGLILGIVFNNRGVLGLLPVIANLEYSIAVFIFRDNEKALKLSFIFNMVMYAIFSLVIKSYVGAVSCTVIAVTTITSMLKSRKPTVQ